MAASDDGRAASPPPAEGETSVVEAEAKKAEQEAAADASARLSGIVKWFNASKGASQVKRGCAGRGGWRPTGGLSWVNWLS